MNGNPLLSIGELREMDSYDLANNYLGVGWVLLSTHTVGNYDLNAPNQQTIYCLGWPKELGDAVHPRTREPEAEAGPLRT